MDTRQDCTVEELRQRSEANRAQLASTVEELREKVSDTASEVKTLVSPSHIKEEIKTYIREESDSLVRKARENPLQAAAVGAAIAYPAWSLLRAIPAPLLLIGAGLWLTGSHGRKTIKQVGATVTDAVERGTAEASELASELTSAVKGRIQEHAGTVARAFDEAGNAISSRADAMTRTVGDAGSAVSSRAEAVGSAVKSRADGLTRTLGDAGSAVSSQAEAVAGKVRAATHDVRDAVASTSASLSKSITGAAGDVADQAARTFEDVKHGAVAAGQNSTTAAMEFIDKNPLLVAGIGIAIGAFIAASLPRSGAEDRMFGGTADDLKDKVRDAAAQGTQRAKNLAADAIGDVAAGAAREGLDGAGVQKAVDTVTQGLKAVADRGVRTAVGKSETQQN